MCYRWVLLILIVFALSGCQSYIDKQFNNNEILSEPQNIPQIQNMSALFEAYKDISVAANSENFPEKALIIQDKSLDLSNGSINDYVYGLFGGSQQYVGAYQLRKIVDQRVVDLIQNHFRYPKKDELPMIQLDISPDLISVVKSKDECTVTFRFRFCCAKQGENAQILLDETYEEKSKSQWIENEVPLAIYQALNGIWYKFLTDFKSSVDSSLFEGQLENNEGKPKIKKISLINKQENTSIIFGNCSINCNGWNKDQVLPWAKNNILFNTSNHLGENIENVRIVYKEKEIKYNEINNTLLIPFFIWPEQELNFYYNQKEKSGIVIYDFSRSNRIQEMELEQISKYIIGQIEKCFDDNQVTLQDISFDKIETKTNEKIKIFNFLINK